MLRLVNFENTSIELIHVCGMAGCGGVRVVFGWNHVITCDRCRNRENMGYVPPHFSQIIRQSAPLQPKELPVFVYEGDPEYMCPPTF